MPYRLKQLLLVWIAACQVYLFAHSQEPLRLDIGDPWSDANVLCSIHYVKEYGFLTTSFTDVLDVGPLTKDSYHYTHYPPLAEITYGAVGKYLGVESIGIFRLFALVFSAAAMFFLFTYVRRMWNDNVALLAVALWQGSLMWLLYADSIHQAPIFQLATWGGLCGLERAVATRQKRFYAAAVLGAFACFLTSYDGWLFLPGAVVFTVWIKSGRPWKRGNRHYVLLCAGGCVLALVAKSLFVIGAVGWDEFVRDVHFQFLERSTSTFESFGSPWPTLVRRFTQVFSPLVWVPIVYYAVRAVRARTLADAFGDGMAWMLAAALLFLKLFAELAASQLLASQVMLPFYAIGTALLLDRLLARSQRGRIVAYAWLGAVFLWGTFFFVRLPRAVMVPDEIAKVNEYLDAHDHNDFVLNNLMASGQIQWAFHRHDLYVYSGDDESPEAEYYARVTIYQLFQTSGADTMTAIIFKDPYAFYVDKSLWPIAMVRHQWSAIGSPFIWKAKTVGIIDAYLHRVQFGMRAVGAKRVLELPTMDVYRIDRGKLLSLLADAVPYKDFIDVTGYSSTPNRLLGWGGSIVGSWECPTQGVPCKTALTKRGVVTLDAVNPRRADLLLRVPASCDLHLRARLRRPAPLAIELGGFRSNLLFGETVDVTVPREYVKAGVNLVRFDGSAAWMLRTKEAPGAQLVSVEIVSCGP